MSVIYGIIHTNGTPIRDAEIDLLRNELNDVKFDREATWRETTVHLGVQLRQLVNNDAEQAPLQDSGLVICADARLDNRKELAEKLGISLESLDKLSDSQLILKAYQKWGKESPKKLLGDFAYVIYDKNSKQLFCARDYIGIRPFYYYWVNGCFSFCTMRHPLMVSCPVTPTPNDMFIVASFIESGAEASHTIANEILRLPPAHSLTIDETGIQLHRYWEPRPMPLLQLANEEEYANAMRELFTRAVTCRTQSDHQIGSHLSSGLDSGSVTVLAARALHKQGKKLLAFSWSPEPNEISQALGDERDLILDVCRQEQIECQFSKLKSVDMFSQQPQYRSIWGGYLYQHETDHLPSYLKYDCRIMLSGWGGDEFASYCGSRGFLADLLLQKNIVYFMSQALRLRLNGMLSTSAILKQTLYPLLPDAIYRHYIERQGQRESFINAKLESLLGQLSQKRDRWHQRDLKRVQRRLLLNGYLHDRIEIWAQFGEIYGVNYLYPMLDKRLVEFVLAIPIEQLSRNGWRRFLFRNAMQGILPASVQWNKSKMEPALESELNVIRSSFRRSAQDRIQEIRQMPAFGRYFSYGTVMEAASSLVETPYWTSTVRKIFAYTQSVGWAFSDMPKYGEG